MVAPTPTLEPGVPGWMQRYALSAAKTFRTLFPDRPDRLWPVLFAELPPAADWRGCQVYVTDKAKVGLSNGTSWTDPAGGAL